MKYSTTAAIVLILMIGIMLISYDNAKTQEEQSYEKLVTTIEDYWFEQKGKVIKQISYLPGFDNRNIDHWRALLQYGYIHTYPASKLGKNRLIFFVNSNDVEKQYSFDMLTDHNRSIVIGLYQTFPDGKQLFTTDPFFSFEEDEDYFSVLEKNKDLINAKHFNALD